MCDAMRADSDTAVKIAVEWHGAVSAVLFVQDSPCAYACLQNASHYFSLTLRPVSVRRLFTRRQTMEDVGCRTNASLSR